MTLTNPPPPSDPSHAREARVLLVDDDRELCQMLTEYLSAEHFEVKSVHDGGDARDPFDANQGIPTLLFGRGRPAFEAAFPQLSIARVQHLSGFSCPASGGFSHGPFLPWPLWSLLHRLDARLPPALMRWTAFRMLVVLERSAG